MIKLKTLLGALVTLLWFTCSTSSLHALDYFTAPQEGQALYRDTATQHHVDVVPGWLRQGRINDAIADLKYTLERFPNHPKALQYMGLVSKLTNNTEMAIAYYQQALSLYPQYAVTHAQYGQYLLSIGIIDKAIESLKRSIAIEPKSATSYALLAQAYSKQGNSELASEAAARAKELGYKGPGIEGTK